MARILIVEDEAHLAEGVQFNLRAEGHESQVVTDAESALEVLRNGHGFDALVLDVMLPGMSGYELAKSLRDRGEYVPILMLTARNRSQDVMQGFAAGADDYLPKPFELGILIARINGLLRRKQWAAQPPQASPPERLTFGTASLDMSSLELEANGRKHQLTTMEANLLRYFITHSGQALSRKKILEDVWGLREDTDTRAIDNFIARLRKYIEKHPAVPKHLLTVRGVGYKFVVNPK
ncbi:MAG TPA: response regulator transcription factor [Terriglobales bacterium]|nr:response regulator transcription factor [Terriglobales bacterium]